MASLFRTHVDLDDNEGRQIDNPLAHIEDLYALDTDAKAFARRIDPESPDKDLWVKAARVARDPLGFSRKSVPKLTDQEYNILKNQRLKGFWSQPKALQGTIATLCLGAIIQGWSQTSGNGANQTWPQQFGLRKPNNDWVDGRSLWIFGACNAVTYLAASIFGCWLSDPLQSWILGRRGAFFVSCLLILASVVGGAYTCTWRQYMACRAILGLGMGANASVVPIMGAEVSPPHLRGALVMNWQLMDALGIFMGFTSNLVVAEMGLLTPTWRLQTASAMLPTICALSLIPIIPESPRFYLNKGKLREAFRVLLYLRGSPIQAATELYYMYAQIQAEVSLLPRKLEDAESNSQSNPEKPSAEARSGLRRKAVKTWNAISRHVPDSELDAFQRRIKKTSYFTRLWQLLRDKRTFRAIVAAFVVMAGQQLCGVYVLAFYSSTFFADIHNDQDALWLSWGLGAANFVFTFPVYYFINKRGRRFTLLFWSYPGMFLSMLAARLAFMIPGGSARPATIAFSTFCCIFFCSVGQGPVPFAYSSEIFTLLNREQGMSFAVFVNFFGAGLFTLFVPKLTKALQGDDLFVGTGQSRLLGIFAGLNVFSFLLIFLLVPETAGATLGKEEGSLNYISVEELNYIFCVSTREHVRYQVQHVLPWAWRWVKWFVQRRLLFKRDAKEPDELEELYTWVSVRNLKKEEKRQVSEVVWGGDEDEIVSQAPEERSVGPETHRPSYIKLVREKGLFTSFCNLLRKWIKPHVRQGFRRVEWTCSCGRDMYRDYDNSDPDALNAFISDLSNRQIPLHTVQRSNDESRSGFRVVSNTATSTGSITGSNSTGFGSAGASRGGLMSESPKATTSAPPGQTSQILFTQNQSISPRPSQADQRKKRFLELCVNTGQHTISLGEIEVGNAKSDGEVFARINQRYHELRGFRFQRIFKKPADVHFVHFALRRTHRVWIREKPNALPPKTEIDEERHADEHQDNIYLRRLPKRLEPSIYKEQCQDLVFGWGIHIIEGPNKVMLGWACFIVLLLSFVVSVVYAVALKTSEQGFGIGQWMVACFGSAVAALYFQWEEY